MSVPFPVGRALALHELRERTRDLRVVAPPFDEVYRRLLAEAA